ncbi:MAG: alkaline phosphatase family protein [Nitrospiraceae bacterium]|nr:alkaline phosphatase family protein [Nitrospiraceae bacterium]
MPKVMIIGLDGGTFDLIGPWVEQGKLPNLAKLMRTGLYRNLRSTLPPMTFPAWNAFMTGRNPGKHGVFDFMERKDGTYELDIMNARHRKCETMWKTASKAGKRCAVIGVPVTYPPEEINGIMISGFDAPFMDERIMYPRELFHELKENVGEYIVSASFAKHLKAGRIDKAVEAMSAVLDRKAATASYILNREPWDLFMIVFGETDAAIHHFWKYHDMDCPQRDKGRHNCGFDPIYGIYEQVDKHIGDLLSAVSDETTVIVMSDHGAGGAGDRVIYVNKFLESQGLLTFKTQPATARFHKGLDKLKASVRVLLPKKLIKHLRFNPKGIGLKWEAKLRFSYIDWTKTKVYSEETPYYPTLRVNLRGREPDGTVEKSEYNDIVKRTISLLHEWTDDSGRKLVRRAYSKEELYHGDHMEKAPDIIISWDYDNGYSYLSRPSFVCQKKILIDTMSPAEIRNSDFMLNRSGSHRDEGIFIISGSKVDCKALLDSDIHITDLAPTVLHLLGLPVPSDMDGKVLMDCFYQGLARTVAYRDAAPSGPEEGFSAYSEEETDEIRDKLKGLGYL